MQNDISTGDQFLYTDLVMPSIIGVGLYAITGMPAAGLIGAAVTYVYRKTEAKIAIVDIQKSIDPQHKPLPSYAPIERTPVLLPPIHQPDSGIPDGRFYHVDS